MSNIYIEQCISILIETSNYFESMAKQRLKHQHRSKWDNAHATETNFTIKITMQQFKLHTILSQHMTNNAPSNESKIALFLTSKIGGFNLTCMIIIVTNDSHIHNRIYKNRKMSGSVFVCRGQIVCELNEPTLSCQITMAYRKQK